jgi:isopentenyl-diphosphate delta-isomerase
MRASQSSKARLSLKAAAPPEPDRKADHLRLAMDRRMQLGASYFESWAFEHQALPELDLARIETGVSFLGKRLSAPLLISCMTGGTEEATRINRNLARAAEATGIAFGVGSQRRALEDNRLAESFRVRPFAPTVPLLANLGAVQLNYGYGERECLDAIAMLRADALVFHLNPLQEAIQPEGQTDFSGLIPKLGRLADRLPVPVIVKEIGCGLSADLARELLGRGIEIVDTAGVGGTTWARIEAARAEDEPLGELFADWGIPTPESIRQLRDIPGLTVIGSGGLRHGLDLAKSIALGAHLGGMAYPFLLAASESAERVREKIERTVHELKVAMFCCGCRTIAELRRARIMQRPPRARAGCPMGERRDDSR